MKPTKPGFYWLFLYRPMVAEVLYRRGELMFTLHQLKQEFNVNECTDKWDGDGGSAPQWGPRIKEPQQNIFLARLKKEESHDQD